MLFAPPPAPFPPPPSLVARLQQMLGRLASHGVCVAKTAAERIKALAAAPRSPQARAEHTGIAHVLPSAARAIRWAVYLAQIIAGEVPPPVIKPRAPTPANTGTAPKTQAAPEPEPGPAANTTQALRDALALTQPQQTQAHPPGRSQKSAQDAWMRRVFATRSIGYILDHICADLAIDEDDDGFCRDDLLAITQTPAQWAAARAAPAAQAPHPGSSPIPMRERPGEGAPSPLTQPGPPNPENTP